MQIKDFVEIECLLEFCLHKRNNAHSICQFSASILENKEDACLKSSGSTISVIDDSGRPLFYGRIDHVEVEHTQYSSTVMIKAVSLSILLDEKTKNRIFHAPEKKWSDILSKNRLKIENGDLRLENNLGQKKCEPVILQYLETNFAFLLRMAAQLKANLWVIDTRQQSQIFIGKSPESNTLNISSDHILSCTRICHGKEISWRIQSDRFLDLGSIVKIDTEAKDSTQYIIYDFKLCLEHGSWRYWYELIPKDKQSNTEISAPLPEKSVLLHATVKDSKDSKNKGRIQVEFDDKFIEDMDKDKRLWVPWHTPYTGKEGGIVFIPDVGDPAPPASLGEAAGERKDQEGLDEDRQDPVRTSGKGGPRAGHRRRAAYLRGPHRPVGAQRL